MVLLLQLFAVLCTGLSTATSRPHHQCPSDMRSEGDRIHDASEVTHHAMALSIQRQSEFVIRDVLRLPPISVAEFENKYASPEVAVPLIFEHVMDDVWDLSDWTREAVARNCGASKLIDESEEGCDGPSAAANEDCHSVRRVNRLLIGKEWAGLIRSNLDELNITTMKEFLELQDTPAGSDLYLHDCPLLQCCPSEMSKLRVPKYFTTDYRYLENDPDLVGDLTADQYHFPSLFIGKQGSGSPLHNDADMSRFWVHLLSGKKLWRIFPPSENWRLYPTGTESFYPSIFSVDAMEPDFDRFPNLRGALVYEAVLDAGEVIFVPEGWAHQVINLKDSISTTMNFVDWSGLGMHLKYKEHEFGKEKYGISYMRRVLTSFLVPLDSNQADENKAFDAYFSGLHFRSMNVPTSVKEWVERRSKWPKGIDTYRSDDGFGALHLAVSANFLSVVEYLLDHGADISMRDYRGRTAMQLAQQLGHDAVYRSLESHHRRARCSDRSSRLRDAFLRSMAWTKRLFTLFLAMLQSWGCSFKI